MTWHTDEPAVTRLAFGPRGGTMEVLVDPALVTEHTVPLTGLVPGREYVCEISATDAAGNIRTHARVAFVTPYPGRPGGFAPVLNGIGAKRVYEGETLCFTVSAEDRDSEELSFSADGLPPGARFDPPTGRFTWTPKPGDAGIYRVRFTVSDGTFTDTEEVTIFVRRTEPTEELRTSGGR